MGSTYIEYKGKGFEADDFAIEVWLMLIVQEIDKLDPAPAWLAEMREEWNLQATAGFGYGVMAELDHFATDAKRCNMILDLCRRAEKVLRGFGDPISEDVLNALET